MVGVAFGGIVFRNNFISDTCEFQPGLGNGGTAFSSFDLTAEACLPKCVELKKADPAINGVAVFTGGSKGCLCKKNMNTISAKANTETCFLEIAEGTRLFVFACVMLGCPNFPHSPIAHWTIPHLTCVCYWPSKNPSLSEFQK